MGRLEVVGCDAADGWMKKGKGFSWWWEWERSYKDERGLTCLPQVLQKINPLLPRQNGK
jgi:hypothetical protein